MGGLWGWFTGALTQVLAIFANFFGDWGVAIIVLTFIIRVILTPMTLKSTKSSAKMSVLQPMIKDIQERYADDPMKQQQEMQRIYTENKFNPLGGCLPMLLQMPIFFALFQVLKEVPADACFLGVFPSLAQSVSGSISSVGWLSSWVYILFDVMFGALTLIPMLLNMKSSGQDAASSSLVMGVVMAVMMMFFGWSVPVGVLLYYNTSSLWGVVQQVFITKRITEKYKREAEEKMGAQPVHVDVVRKEKKKRPTKKK